jgi:phosphatidate cytidylyltransferase
MFAARLLTAVVLLLLFCSALFFLPNFYWGGLLLAALFVGAWEWSRLCGYGARWRICFSGAVVLAGLALLVHGEQSTADAARIQLVVYWIAVLFWLTVVPIWLLQRRKSANPWWLGITGWTVLVPTWLALTVMQRKPEDLLAILGIVWIADTAAYLAGRSYGKHLLAPQLSPGKTWEGIAGAAAGVAVYYAVLWVMAGAGRTAFEALLGILFFAAIMVFSVEGDLFESWMKRGAGLKDSGALLPGHGGILDRIDGLTAAIPFAALWLQYCDVAAIP